MVSKPRRILASTVLAGDDCSRVYRTPPEG